MKNHTIITIGRQYGSGGREIGERLAEALSVPYYDRKLLNVAAQKSGMCEEIFETHDEKPTNSFLYSLVAGTYGENALPLNHKLFLAQFEAIRSIAEEGPCVIIGRCADYALEDNPNLINFFIHADIKERVKRAVEQYGVAPEKAQETVIKTDKKRASYYNFYSSRKWGNVDNYHLTIDSSKLGIDNTIKVLLEYVKAKSPKII